MSPPGRGDDGESGIARTGAREGLWRVGARRETGARVSRTCPRDAEVEESYGRSRERAVQPGAARWRTRSRRDAGRWVTTCVVRETPLGFEVSETRTKAPGPENLGSFERSCDEGCSDQAAQGHPPDNGGVRLASSPRWVFGRAVEVRRVVLVRLTSGCSAWRGCPFFRPSAGRWFFEK